jgi:4-hydroxythreonine-4-phosphate dehydrogenase
VLGLNPHAGDGGVLGDEELEIIEPAMREALPFGAFGPFPADAFFGLGSQRDYDAVLAMYHDQGLIHFKALAFDTGVNFTAGLPIVRTSPDHGTAFDIAGKGIARIESMKQALLVAADVAEARAQRRGM